MAPEVSLTTLPHLLMITVATAEIQFENYVLSRGGTRLIRKVLVANNGRKSPCQSNPGTLIPRPAIPSPCGCEP